MEKKKSWMIPVICVVVIVLCFVINGVLMSKTPTAGAANEAPVTVETGNPVQVLSAQDWAEKYPDQYNSYMKNSENTQRTDYVVDYPYIATIYEGMAFNQYYTSAVGHVYTVQDITETGRPHKLANCLTCKTPDFTAMVNEQGDAAYQMAFEDALSQVNESISCYNCHANSGDQLVVTHSYLTNAMGDDLEDVAPATLSCGQCHVEYYFNPETKATTLPYSGLETMSPDAIIDLYDEMGFADYTNPRTGTAQIKVQHPEFETVMGEGSAHAGLLTCADCHMGTSTSEQGFGIGSYTNHTWASPFAKEETKNSCVQCHGTEDMEVTVRDIQADTEERTNAIGAMLEELTNKLAEAVESGDYTEDELNAIRQLNRRGQFYWDFVFVENSEGAHNTALTTACLDKAEAYVNEALALFK